MAARAKDTLATLQLSLRQYGLVVMTEYRFAPPRRWRFDLALPEVRIALEVEGGAFVAGRHVRGAGFRADLEKYGAATIKGWRVLRVLPEQLASGEAFRMIQAALETTGEW